MNPGELIDGKYRINAVLGEGGMGVVYGATHVDLQRSVALKVIRPEFRQQPELVARLMIEARAAAQIKSEHVCRVLDVGRLGSGVPYIVMEYLEGRNLSSLLQARGRLTERQSVDHLLQACEALAEAHRLGIIHRDLKPENLFLAEFPDGRRAIKVLDFGISKVTSAMLLPTSSKGLTNPSAALGSPHFMAPEQMAAARDVDARADIWALGAILYQLLSGRFAFDGHSLPAVCAAVLQTEPAPIRSIVAEVSPGVELIIAQCLAKQRDQRLSSVVEFAERLAPFGSSSATQSAMRISRLLRVSTPGSGAAADGSGSTPSSQPSSAPLETTEFSQGPTTPPVVSPTPGAPAFKPHDGSKKRYWLFGAIAAACLLSVVSYGLMARSRPQAAQQPVGVPQRAAVGAGDMPSHHSVNPSPPQEASLEPALETRPAPIPSSTNAQPKSSNAAVATTSSSLQHPRAPQARPAVTPQEPRPLAKKLNTRSIPEADLYNSENFGGRR